MMQPWEIEGYDRLRTEVVRQAVKDLLSALRKSDRLGYPCEEQISLEKWFLSAWGQMLCCDTGSYIIEKCRKTYKRAYSTGKTQLPDDVQKQICEDCNNGVRPIKIYKKYGVSRYRMQEMQRRWEK